MTPQERQLVTELFERLTALENAPRDPDAERAIAEGLARAPNGIYALVQTAIVQDEALKRANARIAELEGQSAEPPTQGGFLDNMRETLFGHGEQRGSVPTVHQTPGGTSGWAGGPPPPPSAYGQPAAAAPIGSGGSFLGTAAASAAGAIGGAMLLNGIRSMFGHSAFGASAYDPGRAPGMIDSPWGGSSAADSDLASQAGIDRIGNDRTGERDDSTNRTGLFGGDDQNDNDDHDSNDDDGNDDDDTDFAGDDGDFDGSDIDSA